MKSLSDTSQSMSNELKASTRKLVSIIAPMESTDDVGLVEKVQQEVGETHKHRQPLSKDASLIFANKLKIK